MTPFEKALIDAVLEEYADIPDCGSDADTPDIATFSLWINRDTKTVYVQETPGTAQIFFRNTQYRNACIQYLIRVGYRIQN